MKFRSLMLFVVLLSFFIAVSSSWAVDAPTSEGDGVISASLDSPASAAVFASESAVDHIIYMSSIKSVTTPTKTYIKTYMPAEFIRQKKEDPGKITTTSYSIDDGTPGESAFVKGAQRNTVMLC